MSLRGKVLGSYRLLLRACESLCQDDVTALRNARNKIRDEFKKHRDIRGKTEIEGLLCTALEAERYLRQNVVQVVPVKEDQYKLRITEETVLPDNPVPPAHPPP